MWDRSYREAKEDPERLLKMQQMAIAYVQKEHNAEQINERYRRIFQAGINWKMQQTGELPTTPETARPNGTVSAPATQVQPQAKKLSLVS